MRADANAWRRAGSIPSDRVVATRSPTVGPRRSGRSGGEGVAEQRAEHDHLRAGLPVPIEGRQHGPVLARCRRRRRGGERGKTLEERADRRVDAPQERPGKTRRSRDRRSAGGASRPRGRGTPASARACDRDRARTAARPRWSRGTRARPDGRDRGRRGRPSRAARREPAEASRPRSGPRHPTGAARRGVDVAARRTRGSSGSPARSSRRWPGSLVPRRRPRRGRRAPRVRARAGEARRAGPPPATPRSEPCRRGRPDGSRPSSTRATPAASQGGAASTRRTEPRTARGSRRRSGRGRRWRRAPRARTASRPTVSSSG